VAAKHHAIIKLSCCLTVEGFLFSCSIGWCVVKVLLAFAGIETQDGANTVLKTKQQKATKERTYAGVEHGRCKTDFYNLHSLGICYVLWC